MLRGLLRRVGIRKAAGGRWTFKGYSLPDFGAGASREEGDQEEPVEVFQGLFFYALPADGDNAEVILAHVGGQAEHPVMIGFRNEDARKRYVETFGELGAGECAIFNSAGTVHVRCKASGDVEVNGLQVKLGAPATDALVKGTTYRGAEDVLFASLAALLAILAALAAALASPSAAAIGGPAQLAAGNVATPAGNFVSALALFTSAAPTFLSTKSKTQ